MGMSAAQARLLSITTRLTNNEFRSQTITNSKLRLADKSSEASQEYMNALNSQQLMFGSYNSDGQISYQQLTPGILTTFSDLKNQYGMINSAGKILVSGKDAKNYENSNTLEDFLKNNNIQSLPVDLSKIETPDIFSNVQGLLKSEFSCWNSTGITGPVKDGESFHSNYIRHIEHVLGSLLWDETDEQQILTVTNGYNTEYITKYGNTLSEADAVLEECGISVTKFIANSDGTYSYNDSGTATVVTDNLGNQITRNFNINGQTYTGYAWEINGQTYYTTFPANNSSYFTKDGELDHRQLNDYIYHEKDGEKYKPSGITEELEKVNDKSGEYTVVRNANNETFLVDKDGYHIKSNQDNEPLYLPQYPGYIVNSNGDTSFRFYTVLDKGFGLTADKQNELNDIFGLRELLKKPENKDLLDELKLNYYQYLAYLSSDISKDYGEANNGGKAGNQMTAGNGITMGEITNHNNAFISWDEDYYNSLSTTDLKKEYKDNLTNNIVVNFTNLINTLTVRTITDIYESKDDRMALLDEKISEENRKKIDQEIDEYKSAIENYYEADTTNSSYQWYVNLWYRMGGTSENTKSPVPNYKELDENLMNNSEWLQFALEHGVITLEQAAFNQNGSTKYPGMGQFDWNSIVYTSASDISLQDDSIAIARAEVKYNNAMREIENQDKKFDQDLKKLDAEHSALQTEYESVKSVVDKNVERSFKAFS